MKKHLANAKRNHGNDGLLKLVLVTIGWAIIMTQFNVLSTYIKYGSLDLIILVLGSVLAGINYSDVRLGALGWLPAMIFATLLTYFSYMSPVILVLGSVIQQVYIDLQFLWSMQQLLMKTMMTGVITLFTGLFGCFLGEAYT